MTAQYLPMPNEITKDELKEIIKHRVVETLNAKYADSLHDTSWSSHEQLLHLLPSKFINLLRGQNEDELDLFGMSESAIRELMPLLERLVTLYWRVEVKGIEHVPANGRALLVANHSGVLPWDALVVAVSIWRNHPSPRPVRFLFLDSLSKLPFINVLLNRLGMVQANPRNAIELLEQDQLTGVFPEGIKGIGKPFRERYALRRFGRGGFVRVASQTHSPVIPVSIVGGEELYPMLYNSESLASLFNLPYFPITPTFPWLGVLGFIPLASKWIVQFGEPITWDHDHSQSLNAQSFLLEQSERVRGIIQHNILSCLRKRRSIILG